MKPSLLLVYNKVGIFSCKVGMIDSRSIKKVLKQAGVVYNYINHSMHVTKTIKTFFMVWYLGYIQQF